MGRSQSLVPPIIRPGVRFSHRAASSGTLTSDLPCKHQPAAAKSISLMPARDVMWVLGTYFRHRHGHLRANRPRRPPVCVFIVHTQGGGLPALDSTILLI